MAEEAVDGGQIELEVVADVPGGFERKLRRDVERRVRDIKARIQAEVDTRRVAAETRAAAQAAERAATVKVTLDRSSLGRELREALASLSGQSTSVRVNTEVDAAQMRRQVDQAARSSPATVNVKANTLPARDEMGRFVKGSGGGGGGGGGSGWLINLAVKVDDKFLTPVEAKLRQLGVTVGMVTLKYGALAVAAGIASAGLLAVGASASQAVGVLAILPGVIGVAVQGLAGLFVGLSGVGTALGALSQADKVSAGSAGSSAAAREAAAERIKNAERAIRDAAHARMLADERVGDAKDAAVEAAKAVVAAEERVKEAVERVAEARARVAEAVEAAAERQAQAARQVEMAERRVEQAQRSTTRAQEALNEARKQAKERLEDLALAVKGGALDDESAQIAIERAKERLDKVLADPFATDLDKREADLAFRQAKQRLDEVRERNQDLAEESADANARGVEGSKEVQSAKEALADSIQAEADAEYELGQARKDAAKAAVESARAIADAQKGVQEALKGVKDAQDGVKDAQKAQERAARDVREALWDQMLAAERLADAHKELAKAKRDAKTAGQTGGGGVDPAAQALADLSPKMRDFVLFLHNKVRPELREIRIATQEALAPGLKAGVEAAMPLLDTIKQGFSGTGTVIGDVARDLGKLMGTKAFNGYVSRIMGRNNTAIQLFGKAGVSAFKGYTRIVDVAMPYVVRFADKVAGVADRFDKWTKRAREDGSLDKFFSDAWTAADRLWRLLSNVGGVILRLGKLALPSGSTLINDLAEAAEDLNAWLDKPEVQARFKRFFDELVPLLRTAGSLIGAVVKFVGKLIEKIVVDGTLTDFLGWLRDVVNWMSDLLDNPVVGEIAKWLVIFALAATAIGLITKKISGLISGLKLLGKAAKGLSKLSMLSKLFGGKDDKGGKGGSGGEVDTVNIDADKVNIDDDGRGKTSKTTTTSGRAVPNTETKGRKSSKRTGGRGLGAGVASIVGDAAVDALGSVDWDKQLKSSGVGSKIGGVLGKVGKGGILGTIAAFIADPIGDAIAGGNNKGLESALGSALKEGTAGAGIGALVGSIVPGIGTAIGGAIGGALGSIKGGIEGYFGERLTGAGVKNAFSLDGFATFLKEAGRLFGGAGNSIQEKWASLWRGLDNGTKTGADGLQSRLGGFLDVTSGKFTTLAKGAPQNIQTMWASIKRDLDAGISPSQAKIDAFVRAGGAGFLKLGKDAPKELQEGWRQVQLGIDTFTSVASNKLGTFANTANGKFLTLKQNAPQHVSSMWSDIQAKISAGVPVPQKQIDDFIAAGGGGFLKLKKDAPAHVRDALSEINNNLQTGLAAASLKLGGFVQDGNGKFLKLKADAPKSVASMWTDIKAKIDAGKPVSQKQLDDFVKAGGASFLKLGKDAPAATKKTWSDIAAGVDPGLKPAKDKVAATTKEMEKSFGTAKSGIQKVWEALPNALKAPISWIVNTAYGKIRSMWNGIARAVGFAELPPLAFATGGVVPAGGHGVMPGYSPGRDTMLAAVSPGEGWLRPELTRALGPAWVDGGNRAARTGGVTAATRFVARAGMAFANGGTVKGGKNGTSKKKEQTPLEKLLAGVSSAVRGIFSKGLGAGARSVLNPVKNAITSAIGTQTQVQQLLGRIPAHVIDRVIAKFDAKDGELNRDRGGALPPGRSRVYNGTGRDEWVLTPAAVAALGGPKAVQRLNEGGPAALYAASRRSKPRQVDQARQERGGDRIVNVYPQPGQSEYQIGRAASRQAGSRVS
ncbi:hypothetical protein ACGFJC_47190 [Nonomuraea fuscirosea]|uniref:hypothetical protein n=1 Tax=Nonomuraea fuscirosea TaxID=1291556 RepID=UPI00371B3EFF